MYDFSYDLLSYFQARETAGTQIITANGQTYSVMPQAQMQTVTIDGQEAIYIPASVQHAPTAATQQIQIAGNQAIFAPPGQIIRAQSLIQNVQGVGQVGIVMKWASSDKLIP